jgi:DMSO reductase anchor subunit
MPPPQDSAATAAPLTFEERMTAAKYLTENYQGVQQAYLWLSVVAVGLVLAMAGWMAFVLKDWKTVIPMFGASGVLSLSLGRLLHTWNTISRILVEGKLP